MELNFRLKLNLASKYRLTGHKLISSKKVAMNFRKYIFSCIYKCIYNISIVGIYLYIIFKVDV